MEIDVAFDDNKAIVAVTVVGVVGGVIVGVLVVVWVIVIWVVEIDEPGVFAANGAIIPANRNGHTFDNELMQPSIFFQKRWGCRTQNLRQYFGT